MVPHGHLFSAKSLTVTHIVTLSHCFAFVANECTEFILCRSNKNKVFKDLASVWSRYLIEYSPLFYPL